ncbi:hypothetical protein Mal15_68100 [Stieleria maiorica]|uniref:Uncharacterized protein n=1 Tax=Stieleria maiorica TaxID=2795974 RepID=A0A5B9MMT5_9BACT|nr:hypothetical protein [Stieleria maiorica]QEG02689.1 hypothetical protein Mal15_68100 [Stieleria maiorica]
MTSPNDDQTDRHADKYNDPRAQISRRGILIGLGVVLFGIAGAALSIWARRTRLEQTTKFWGPETIQAFQLAAEIHLIVQPEPLSEPSTELLSEGAEPVRLTGMPGLGHLRHLLLDDRSYLWSSVKNEPMRSRLGQTKCMMLRFSDPEAERFPDAEIIIDLDQGWIGKHDGDRQIRLNERFRNAVPAFLTQVADYEPLRVEMRETNPPGE